MPARTAEAPAVGPGEIVDRQQVLHALLTPDLDRVGRAVDLGEADPHILGDLGRQVLADVVGPDRQFPMPAVDEHRELHRARATQLEQCLERGPRGAAGEQDVVDEHHDAVGDVGDLGRSERRDRSQPDVVAVEGDVERAGGHLDRLEARDRGADTAGERDAARVHADEHRVRRAVVALDDLVGDTGDGPAQVGGVEDTGAKHLPGTGLTLAVGTGASSPGDLWSTGGSCAGASRAGIPSPP